MSSVWRRLRSSAHHALGFLFAGREDREMREEMRFHLEMAAEKNRAAGMTRDESQRAASIQFGSVSHWSEAARDEFRSRAIPDMVRDIRYAARSLRRSPGFSVAVVLLLGVGIGMGTAVFTLVYAMLARPLPIRDPAGIVNVYQRLSGRYRREVNGSGSLLSYAEFQEYSKAPAFSSSSVYHEQELTVARVTEGPVSSQLVSCDYFRTLGVRMTVGRAFVAGECAAPGNGPVAILGYGLWKSQFGGDSSLVGRTIDINGLPLTVVGVAEPRFRGIALEPASLWVPVTMQPALEHGRDSILLHPNASWLVMTARLLPGASEAQGRTQLAVIAGQRDRLYPGRVTTVLVRGGALLNLPDATKAGALPLALTLVLGFVVLAMACVNATGLTLSRGLARQRELAIRLSIGASRAQVIRHLMAETVLLALGGIAVGLTLSAQLPRAFGAVSAVAAVQLDGSPDMRIVAFSLVLAIGALVMVGLVPALNATRTDPSRTFRGEVGVGFRRGGRSRLRAIVVGTQVGASALLLVMAALFLRASLRASAVNPGYATTRVIAFSMNATSLGMSDERINEVYRGLVARISHTPGVDGIALAAQLPLLHTTTLTIESDQSVAEEKRSVEAVVASPSYFRTMGIRILRGVPFDSVAHGDTREAVVSASMAAALWPNQDPIGRRFKDDVAYRVVGVASEASQSSLSTTSACMYVAPASPRDMQIVVHTSGSPEQLILQMPRWARETDPALVIRSERIEDRIDVALLPARVVSAATSALGSLALLLASIGLWGIVSYGVAQRRRELAIRLAVGARANQVITMMMRQASRSAAWGLTVGISLAALLAKIAHSFLLGLNPVDPLAYGAVIAGMGLTIAASTLLASLKALHVNPSLLLRSDA